MEPFKTITSLAAPLDRVNVDTDQIIPKQFLKRIERSGYGEFLFFDWRRIQEGPHAGEADPTFTLNDPKYKGAATSASAPSSLPASPTSSSRTQAKTASSSSGSARNRSQRF